MSHPRISRRGVLGLTAATVAGTAAVITAQQAHANQDSTPAPDSESDYSSSQIECLADLYERRMV